MEPTIEQDSIFQALLFERGHQQAKHGESACAGDILTDAERVMLLTEELGEVARAVQDQGVEELEAELVQVAALAVAWLERLARTE